jgi:hypothetical protein
MDEFFTKVLIEINNKYGSNQYVMGRLQNYINNLPTLLENDLRQYEQRIERNDELTNELELFKKSFFVSNKYYYLPINNTFYEYDGKTYSVISEDNILHNLLSTINNEGKLTQWKYKTKSIILREIKERQLFNSIPESYTIEKVTNLLQEMLFTNKQEAKYFLTIIGDGLLKKQTDNMYFVSSNVKEFLNYFNELLFAITHSYSYNSNFISRYHNVHDITNYRLIPEKDGVILMTDFNKLVDKYYIDILCVASYFSKLYDSAENYIITETKDNLHNYVMFFKNKSINTIIEDFVKTCITKLDNNNNNNNNNNDTITDSTISNYYISWRNMLKIWDKYLTEINIPNFIRNDSLKEILKLMLNTSYHINEGDEQVFIGIISKYLSNKQSNKNK